MKEESVEDQWLLLIHQIPPKPAYFRVKIWRRLQRLGAVPIKNSVYALPKSEQTQEDFQWVLREIIERGGDGSVCEARFVDGLTNDQLESLFRAARESDYRQIAEDARRLSRSLPRKSVRDGGQSQEFELVLVRLKRRLAEVVAIDFFGAAGREAAEGLVVELEERLHGRNARRQHSDAGKSHAQNLRGQTWVTRRGVYVDRMASAWLIRRFIDPDAHFKFVPAKGYKPLANEVRFDMFEAEFTHEGDRCTLEVLIERAGIDDAGVTRIAEIVHDIDLKDNKYEHPETTGIERLIAGISMSHKDDDTRLTRGIAMFDDLYAYFRRKRE